MSFGIRSLCLGLPMTIKVSADKAVGYMALVAVGAMVALASIGATSAILLGALAGLPGKVAMH